MCEPHDHISGPRWLGRLLRIFAVQAFHPPVVARVALAVVSESGDLVVPSREGGGDAVGMEVPARLQVGEPHHVPAPNRRAGGAGGVVRTRNIFRANVEDR